MLPLPFITIWLWRREFVNMNSWNPAHIRYSDSSSTIGKCYENSISYEEVILIQWNMNSVFLPFSPWFWFELLLAREAQKLRKLLKINLCLVFVLEWPHGVSRENRTHMKSFLSSFPSYYLTWFGQKMAAFTPIWK